VRADPAGLAALAARLAATASTTAAAIPVGVPHPPLAADTVSAGAAARLNAAGTILASNTVSHVADLGELAARLDMIAGAFGAQEAANAAAQAAVVTGPRRSDTQQQLPPPLVRPPVAPDVRPPLVPSLPPGGEALAAQYAAGSANAGTGFTQGWRSAAAALHQAANDLRTAADWLPDVWRTTAAGAALASVFTTRAATFDNLADQAEKLSTQNSAHGKSFDTAKRSAPTQAEFATNRQNLQTAQMNNARTGGLWSTQVASFTAERSRLEQRAIAAHATYLTDSTRATEPYPGAGDSPQPGDGPDGQPADPSTLDGQGLASDVNSAGIDPATGLPEDPLTSPDGAGVDDPMIAQMMPMLLSTLVGGLGGLTGSLVSPLSSIPQQVLAAGSSALQGATQAASAAAKDFDAPEIPDIKPESPPDIGSGGAGGAGGGETAPAAGLDGMPPVSGAGPMTAPAAPPAAAAGSVPTTATTGSPAGAGMGGGMAPPMMPMGGAPGGAGQDKDEKQETRIALRDLPNSEPVSGEVAQRVEAVAAGTERVAPPDPRRSNVFRITEPESDTK
jgi:hypothetical protein